MFRCFSVEADRKLENISGSRHLDDVSEQEAAASGGTGRYLWWPSSDPEETGNSLFVPVNRPDPRYI